MEEKSVSWYQLYAPESRKRAERKTEIKPDTLKIHLGRVGSMKKNCYLQLGQLYKLSLSSHSQTAAH